MCACTQKFLLAAHQPRALRVSQAGALKAQEMEGKSNEILMWNGEGVPVKSIKRRQKSIECSPAPQEKGTRSGQTSPLLSPLTSMSIVTKKTVHRAAIIACNPDCSALV